MLATLKLWDEQKNGQHTSSTYFPHPERKSFEHQQITEKGSWKCAVKGILIIITYKSLFEDRTHGTSLKQKKSKVISTDSK